MAYPKSFYSDEIAETALWMIRISFGGCYFMPINFFPFCIETGARLIRLHKKLVRWELDEAVRLQVPRYEDLRADLFPIL